MERHPNAREHEAMGIPAGAEERDPAAERRDRDLAVLAGLPEGRRILGWLIARDRRAGPLDGYGLGRRDAGEELERHLRGILPRESYLDVIYPKEGDDNGR